MTKSHKTINAWWPRSPQPGNFGDISTPYILEHVYGYLCKFTPKPFKGPTLLGVGSIISHAEGNSVVWGSGLMRADDPLKQDARYLAVRGPRTYEALKSKGVHCPSVMGDPALIFPRVYFPDNVPHKYKYGLFTHYVDYEMVQGWYENTPDVTVINPINANPFHVIHRMLQCDVIISSSLHGIIAANAYGLPVVWVKHSDKLSGDDTKFHDHYEAVGLKAEWVDFRQPIKVDDLGKFNYQSGITIDVDKIIKSLQVYLDESK